MVVCRKYLSQKWLVPLLLCWNQVALSQTMADEDDILGFLPAIIAAAINNSETTPAEPPVTPVEPPIGAVGNFRLAKTEIFSRVEPTGKASTLIIGYDSLGNTVRQDLTGFNLVFDPTEINLTVVSTTSHDDQGRPILSNSNTTIINSGSEISSKRYRYQSGRLHSTESESVSTSDSTASLTTNSNTVFQYGSDNRLIEATVTTSQTNSTNVTTEQHSVSYDSNNRVNSHRVIRTSNILPASEEILHTHKYDSAGNLIESVTETPQLLAINAYGTLVGNEITNSTVVRNKSTNAILSDFILVATYEVGVCRLRGPNHPYVIEGNITASSPHAPNVGCLVR